jgi:hypothetical protein
MVHESEIQRKGAERRGRKEDEFELLIGANYREKEFIPWKAVDRRG